MHRDHEIFIYGINARTKVLITFLGKEDGLRKVRTCAPMDYGPSRRASDPADRYHLWDYDSGSKNHILSLLPEQIITFELSEEIFDPLEFVTWNTIKSPWFIARDWGNLS